MTQEAIKKVLDKHAAWLRREAGGVKAELREADLRDANLCRANLRGANLCRANLRGADLRGADLRRANLCGANLRGAYLCGANLRGADLRGADLRGADLRGANLRGANLDFSSGISLWCGGSNFKCDAKMIQQVLAHLMTLDCDDAEWIELREKNMPFARKSRRALDLGIVEG